ncbi:E3 SUMO-protein ligase CBX4 [Bagarius yarrelli]|uniref:E3 SUMO-protein ligase CBX4 n=1 Tax=Bagarius yarrelli TaxID=175774 RepID=A0A556VW49_BAGYA|nr:E3 SUMO-protein ligase CBX4 [Bagarius yarrelli]
MDVVLRLSEKFIQCSSAKPLKKNREDLILKAVFVFHREREEQLMGYRKRGPKPKHFLSETQVSSFALRSSVLSQDNEIHLKSPSCGQQFHLDSRMQHPYQNLEDVLTDEKNEEEKQYYHLHGRKHHQYQPDLTLYQQEPDQEHRDIKDDRTEMEKVLVDGTGNSNVIEEQTRANRIKSKLKIVKNKNKNGRIVIVMSKYMENRKQPDGGLTQNLASMRGSGYVDGSMDRIETSERNGVKNSFYHQTGQKETSKPTEHCAPNSSEHAINTWCHSEPCDKRLDSPSFLSISSPNAGSSQDQSSSASLNGCYDVTSDISDSCQDEPMDLSFTGCQKARNAVTHCRTGERTDQDTTETEKPVSPREPERAPSFVPFLGNIIITDVTANCLTVTFKEYVPVPV